MKSAIEAYRIAEQWTFRDCDQLFFHGFYRSIHFWLALLVTSVTLYGGFAALSNPWPSGSENLRHYVMLAMAWVVLPCLRFLREAIRVQRLYRTGGIADREVQNLRQFVATHLLAVLCVCGAFNCVLQIVWDGLLRG
jgi:hypothetical protein